GAPGPRARPARALPRPPPGGCGSRRAERPGKRGRPTDAQPLLPGAEGRPVVDGPGPGRRLLLDGVGVLERVAAAVAGAAGDESSRGATFFVVALQPRRPAERKRRGRGRRAHLPGGEAFASRAALDVSGPVSSDQAFTEQASWFASHRLVRHGLAASENGLRFAPHFGTMTIGNGG